MYVIFECKFCGFACKTAKIKIGRNSSAPAGDPSLLARFKIAKKIVRKKKIAEGFVNQFCFFVNPVKCVGIVAVFPYRCVPRRKFPLNFFPVICSHFFFRTVDGFATI